MRPNRPAPPWLSLLLYLGLFFGSGARRSPSMILLRHRALLFGILGALIIVSLRVPGASP